jgi:hypothetical protein
MVWSPPTIWCMLSRSRLLPVHVPCTTVVTPIVPIAITRFLVFLPKLYFLLCHMLPAVRHMLNTDDEYVYCAFYSIKTSTTDQARPHKGGKSCSQPQRKWACS